MYRILFKISIQLLIFVSLSKALTPETDTIVKNTDIINEMAFFILYSPSFFLQNYFKKLQIFFEYTFYNRIK